MCYGLQFWSFLLIKYKLSLASENIFRIRKFGLNRQFSVLLNLPRMRLIPILLLLAAAPAFAQTIRVEAESFSTQNGIQVVPVNDEGESSQAVGYWNLGDFITFNIQVPREGIYLFTFRVGTNIHDAAYELRDEDNNLLATINPPFTGSHGVFTSITTSVHLKAGKRVLRYISVANNAGADINWFSYSFSREAGAPIVSITEDTTIILTDPAKPVAAKFTAQASDEDGRIESFQWKKISGSGKLSSSSSSDVTITDLPPGEHIFQLSVTDNDKKTTIRKLRVRVKKCEGKRIVITPPNGDGSGLSLQVNGYDKRKIYYPEPGYHPGWNFPKIKVEAGDTIVLSSKHHWSFLDLFGVEGVPGCPVVITADEGIVRIDRGIRLADAKYVKITGRPRGDTLQSYPNGSEDFRIQIRGEDIIGDKKGLGHGGVGIDILGRSAHVEVDMIRVERKAYGVMAKQDPTCDSMYNYPNWIMDDVHIHHCYFENILQDVLYLGNTDPLGTRQITCNNSIVNYKPVRLSNFHVHHNRILIANRTGIQLGGAETGVSKIHDNYISDCGYEFNQQQGTGISIGGMSRNVHVYNNIIKKTFLYGIFDLGTDSSFVYNNHVDSSGFLDMRLYPHSLNLDSLAAAMRAIEVQGHLVLNRYMNGITNIQSTTKETFPHYTKTVFYMNNVLGVNTSKADSKGIISFAEWGPPGDWTENSVVCNNMRTDGKPATIETFRYKGDDWPVYSDDCADSPFEKNPNRKKSKPVQKNKGISRTVIAGGAISLVAIVLLYVIFRKKGS